MTVYILIQPIQSWVSQRLYLKLNLFYVLSLYCCLFYPLKDNFAFSIFFLARLSSCNDWGEKLQFPQSISQQTVLSACIRRRADQKQTLHSAVIPLAPVLLRGKFPPLFEDKFSRVVNGNIQENEDAPFA